MTFGQQLASKIDAQSELDDDESPLRKHLGASIIGDKCMRAVFFQYRWCAVESLQGRMLRLLAHGDREEEIFAHHLRRVGAIVWQKDPATGEQFKIKEHGGHFGGSTDGFVMNLPDLPPEISPDEPILLEMKTHNDRWFKQLVKAQSVEQVKPEHFKQGQSYMHGFNKKGWAVKWCLYCAVNKNDEDLYFELFPYDPELGQRLSDRAEAIIFGNFLPPRISESPSWWECKFCRSKNVCFKEALPLVNCRTCKFSTPLRTGGWQCANGRSEIGTQPKVGCELHEYMPELI